MILSTHVTITLHNRYKQYWSEKEYIDYDKAYPKGYTIKVKVTDLQPNSHVEVQVKCDYCGKIFNKKYCNITKGYKNIEKDCCKNCKKSKIYDVFMENFGCYPMQVDNIADLFRGENNTNYRHDLTEEDRNARNSPEYRLWKFKVYNRDEFCCQVCGCKRKIHAHHMDGWNISKEEWYDIQNGITLCDQCHIKFHNIYGKGNNTKDQYYQFKNLYGISHLELNKCKFYRRNSIYIPGAKSIIN